MAEGAGASSPPKLLTLPKKPLTDREGALSVEGGGTRSGLGRAGEFAAEVGADTGASEPLCGLKGWPGDISAALTDRRTGECTKHEFSGDMRLRRHGLCVMLLIC